MLTNRMTTRKGSVVQSRSAANNARLRLHSSLSILYFQFSTFAFIALNIARFLQSISQHNAQYLHRRVDCENDSGTYDLPVWC